MSHCLSSKIWSPVSRLNVTDFNSLLNRGCNCQAIALVNNLSHLDCQPFPFAHPWWVQVVYIFLFSLIVVLAVGGNLTVIWIVLAHKRMRTVTNYFLLNLAVADTSISVLNVCFSFSFNFYYNWFFGEHYCFFNNFMGIVPTCASSTTLMAMSLDRYMAIVHPLRARLSRNAVITTILMIWVFALACGFPLLLFSKVEYHFFYDSVRDTLFENVLCRSDNWPDGDTATSHFFAAYNWCILIITYILPMFVLSITYIFIAKTLWGSQPIGDHRQVEAILAKKKVVKMLSAVVTIFIVCWLPYHIYFTVLIRIFVDELSPMEALYIYLNIYWLAMTSPVWPPFIYCWMNSRFRSGFKHAYRWLPFVKSNEEQYAQSGLFATRTTSRPAGTSMAMSSRRTSHRSSTTVDQFPAVRYQRPSTAMELCEPPSTGPGYRTRDANSCFSAIEYDSLTVPHSVSGGLKSRSGSMSSNDDI